jgi:hypothetical protein
MNLETIRKIWVMIGSVIVALNASWIPDIITGFFQPEATELVFTALGALVALWQFVKSRTGSGDQPEALKKSAGIGYMLNPFKAA